MPLDAEARRLRRAYLNAISMGDTASASSFLAQMTTNPSVVAQVRATEDAMMRSEPGIVDEPITARNTREYGSIFDPADFEDIAASTRRRGIGAYSTGIGTPPRAQFPTDAEYRSIQFQNFLSNIDTQSRQGARIQEFANKNPQLAQQIFNTSLGLRSRISGAQQKLANIYQTAENLRAKYHDGRFIPDFIANPLGLNNPLVEAGGLIKEGTMLNPQGLTFLKEQKDLGSVLDQMQLDAMGGKVTALIGSGPEPRLDIAFQSATGYTEPSFLKKSKASAAAQIQKLENELNVKGIDEGRRRRLQRDLDLQRSRFRNFSDELRIAQEALKTNPLTSEAIRYQLGSVISAAPEGTMITAAPIGGAAGGRARLYKGMSKGALETIPLLKPINPSQLPTDAEFRLAAAGGGFTPEQYSRGLDLSRRYGKQGIITIKEGPGQYTNWLGQTVNWNPEELKDPLIRASLGLGKNVDVSSLRQNPTNVFLNTRSFNPELPVITTASPQYRAKQVVKRAGKPVSLGTKTLLLDAGINFALGASPGEALVTAISDPISAESMGGRPTAAIERIGPNGEFVDMKTNTVFSPQGQPTNTGIAYKGGKPVIVPRGSVAGEGNLVTITRDVLNNAANVWANRLNALGIFNKINSSR